MQEDPGKTRPFRSSSAAVILLLSMPFIVLSWLLVSAVVKHERQFNDADQVLTVFRTGLAALDALEEMRNLARPMHITSPEPEIRTRYEATEKNAHQELQRLFSLTGRFAAHAPAVAEPLQRLVQTLPILQEAGKGAANEVMGPFDTLTRYIDNTYVLLATALYASALPEGEVAQSAGTLLLIPDTLRLVRKELGVLATLSFPTALNMNGFSSADITILDQSFNNLVLQLDTLAPQLQGIRRHGSVTGAGPDHLQVVHTYMDSIEQDFIFTFTAWDGERAYREGQQAQATISAIATALLDTTAATVHDARIRQRQIDAASAVGLLLLYAALVYFSLLFFRAREAAQHAREMAMEIAERKRREDELRQLNQLSEALMACNTCGDAYEIFGRAAAALFAGAHGALAVRAADSEKLRTVAEWGGASRLSASFSQQSCYALAHGMPQQLTPAGRPSACRHFQSPPYGSHACLPLMMQNESIGLLWIECNDERLGLEGSTQLATSAGETLKLALANIQLREALHEQAVRDALTGLYNRRYLQDIFGREMAQACRSGQPLALALLDIDHFKKVNDTYGHEAGDQALKVLAQDLRQHLRASDISFRHGGEEFVLLLHTDQAGALTAMDKLRTHFHARSFQFGEHSPCQLSFSAGVVEAPLMGDTLEQLLHLADTALYRAKAEGRNRVLAATAET